MPGSNGNSMAPLPSASSAVPTGVASTGSKLGSAFSSDTRAVPPAVIAAASSAADNLFGGLMNQAFAKRNSKLQYKYWKQMFNYQAEYNSPKAQLARLYDAGINPLYNSEFSNGDNTFSGGISSLPEQIVSGNFGASLERFLSLMFEGRQIDINQERAKAENAKDYASAGEAVANTKLTEVKTSTQLQTALANIRALNSQSDLNEEERNYKKALQSQCASFIYATLQRVEQDWQKVAQGWKEQDTKFFTSQWQKDSALYANATDRLQVGENWRHNVAMEGVAAKSNELKQSEIDVEMAKLNKAVRDQDLKTINDILSQGMHSVMGFKITSPKRMENVVRMFSAVSPVAKQLSENFEWHGNLTDEFLGLAEQFCRFVDSTGLVNDEHVPIGAARNPFTGAPASVPAVRGSSYVAPWKE